ncbi:protein FAR-RED IMPAIRED RESPONSE 1-like [Chenopodium quinoa]|uniref:protein FAR-RED IMPAIRED RESPONSE 1-like n=1 Tax=Chenopodium quinoa TaxID=63459 RepID=UPI000B77795D|nr:protein FAR-RED IMPAIRED RESPONSE 1-like [Chenopodium quinoa]
MWVPAFMKHHFWAGMKTTQRVESINIFFDGYVNRNTLLHEFPVKYNRAMTKCVRDENDADARCSKYERRLVSGFKVEKMFQKIYTDTKFQEIQKECSLLMYVYPREERILQDNVVQYLLEDRVWIIPEGSKQEKITNQRRLLCVTFNAETKEVTCDCGKFETFGILCKHCIRVLDQNLVFEIPQKYILERWRKYIVRRHTRVKVSYYDPSNTIEVKRFNKMMTKFESICEDASTMDDPTVDLVMERLAQLSTEVLEARETLQSQKNPPNLPKNDIPPSEIRSNSALADLTPPSVTKVTAIATNANIDLIMDPKTRKKPRGRPKSTRYKSYAETGYKKPQIDTQEHDPVVKHKVALCEEQVVEETPIVPVKRKRNGKTKKKDPNNANVQECNDNSTAATPADDDLQLRNFVGWSSLSNAF